MEPQSFFNGICINLIAFLLGVSYYSYLVIQMRRKLIEQKPILSLLIVFATYGCALLLLLSTFFWQWSGMSSIGAFYLIFIAPIIMLFVLIGIIKKRKLSIYHQLTFLLSFIYLLVVILSAIYIRIFHSEYLDGL